VVRVMEELIPSLTDEMGKLATALRKQKLSDAEFRSQLSQQYVKASGKMTEEICKKYELDLHAFQSALMYYHDNAAFEKALAKLAEQQQKR
jgi:peptidyl-tRNA hydrolase